MVSPKVLFSFIAENKTIMGLAIIGKLLGILNLLIILALYLENIEQLYDFCFWLLFFTFTVSLTVNLTIKSQVYYDECDLLGIPVAVLITR